MTPQLLWDANHLMGAQDPIYREALIAMAQRYVYHRNDVFEVLSVGSRNVEQLDPYFNAWSTKLSKKTGLALTG